MPNKMLPIRIDIDDVWCFHTVNEDTKPERHKLLPTLKISESWLAAHQAASEAYWELNSQLGQLYRKQQEMSYDEAMANEIPHEMMEVTDGTQASNDSND